MGVAFDILFGANNFLPKPEFNKSFKIFRQQTTRAISQLEQRGTSFKRK